MSGAWARRDRGGTGGGEDCVRGTGTTLSDEPCTGGGSTYPAVCECVP